MSGRHYFSIAAHSITPVTLAHRVAESLKGAQGLVLESVRLEEYATSRPYHLTFAFSAPGNGKVYGSETWQTVAYLANAAPTLVGGAPLRVTDYARALSELLADSLRRILYNVRVAPDRDFYIVRDSRGVEGFQPNQAVQLIFSFSGAEESLP